MIFNNTFLDSITEDEHSILYAVLNNNKEVLYSISNANAAAVMNKLIRVTSLTEEGQQLRDSIIAKFKTSTCFVEEDSIDIPDEKPCVN